MVWIRGNETICCLAGCEGMGWYLMGIRKEQNKTAWELGDGNKEVPVSSVSIVKG